MNRQLRRWIAIGTLSGSLVMSAVATAAVGASRASENRDGYVILTGGTLPPPAAQIVHTSDGPLTTTSPQVFNRDART